MDNFAVNIRRSLLFSFTNNYSLLVIQFITSLILARLLSPKEIGIFSVGSTIVALSHMVRDFGVTNYLIQERELTRSRIQTAQGITLMIGWGLGFTLLIASNPIAVFYKEPGILQVIIVLAFNFFLIPFGSITAALLRREMRFDILYKINVFSALMQSSISIILVLKGYGFMSLAWGGLASAITTVLLTFFHRRVTQPWWPTLIESHRVMAVSVKFSGASIFYELGLGGPELITGKLLGFEATGYLSRATGLIQLANRFLMDAIYPVSIPYFSKLAREGNGSFSNLLRYNCILITSIAWPVFAVLAIGAELIISILFGSQWVASALPARLLCVGAILFILGSISSSMSTALGEAHLALELHAKYQITKLLIVGIGGVWCGLTGVAAGIAIGDATLGIVYTWRVCKIVKLDFIVLIRSLVPSLIVTISTCTSTFISLQIVSVESNFLRATLLSFGAIFGWIIGILISDHPLKTEFFDLVGIRKVM